MVWRLLAAIDAVIVAVFAVVAATEPYGVLEQEGADLPNFQGLLPMVVVVALRAVVLAAERHLLPAAHGGYVLAERLASAVGFYYAGVWLYERQYTRWEEILLGGTLGYALVGVAGVGVAALVHAARQGMAINAAGRSPQTGAAAGEPASASTSDPSATPGGDSSGGQPAQGPRALAREWLFGLIGVFVGVSGLVMNVSNVARIGVAVLVGGLITVGVALLTRVRVR